VRDLRKRNGDLTALIANGRQTPCRRFVGSRPISWVFGEPRFHSGSSDLEMLLELSGRFASSPENRDRFVDRSAVSSHCGSRHDLRRRRPSSSAGAIISAARDIPAGRRHLFRRRRPIFVARHERLEAMA